jgi:hypothetical protein
MWFNDWECDEIDASNTDVYYEITVQMITGETLAPKLVGEHPRGIPMMQRSHRELVELIPL